MADELRITTTVATVLREFLDTPTEPHYGFEMMRSCGISSGSLYPILARLEKAGWIASQLEDIDPKVEGRRARRYYTMTPHGTTAATHALSRLSQRLRLPSWAPIPNLGIILSWHSWSGLAFGGAQ